MYIDPHKHAHEMIPEIIRKYSIGTSKAATAFQRSANSKLVGCKARSDVLDISFLLRPSLVKASPWKFCRGWVDWPNDRLTERPLGQCLAHIELFNRDAARTDSVCIWMHITGLQPRDGTLPC